MDDIAHDEKKKYFYYQIIEENGNYIGRIAYTLYKRNKIDYIVNYKLKNNGQRPSEELLKEWQENECLPHKIEQYRNEAARITKEFANQLRKNKEKDLDSKQFELTRKERELKEREKDLREKEKRNKERDKYCHVKSKGAFWLGILQSLIASFIFIVICWIIIKYLNGESDIIIKMK